MSAKLLTERLADGKKRECVQRARNACLPVGRKGNPSGCWKLNEWLQLAILDMRCVGLATIDEILAAFPAELKGVSRSMLGRWLTTIFKAYQAELNKADLDEDATLDVAVHDGDIVAQMTVVWGSAMRMLAKHLRAADWNDLKTPAKYTLLRFLEASTEAAKVQAQANQAEASTQRILLKVRSMLASAEGKPKADRVKAWAEASALIDEKLGLTRVEA